MASCIRQARERELEWLAADDACYDPGPDADQFAISFDEQVIESVLAALIAAAMRPVLTELLTAAANVMGRFDLGPTADVIRYQRLGPVPEALETPLAQLACAAAHALVGASEVRFGGDEQWDTCMRLLEKARVLTLRAAAVG